MDSNAPRVLIAEDNAALLRVTEFAMRRAGFDVETASDGAAALERLRAERFSLLITDQQMPRMTGAELIRAARQLPTHADTPIILLTAKAFEISLEQMQQELGVTHVVGKPFSPAQLTRLVQDLVAASV